MPQPAAEILEEATNQSGLKKIMIGKDRNGRVDMFIYCAQKDRVYQIKVEEIRPRLKGDLPGYDVIGVGDEVCASDELIERVMKYGFDFTKNDEIPQTLEKAIKRAQKDEKMLIINVNKGMIERTTGPHNMFYSGMRSNPDVIDRLRQTLPKKIDGALSAELDSILFKQKLGTDGYIW